MKTNTAALRTKRIRYTLAIQEQLSNSILQYFDPSLTDDPETKKAIEKRYFIEQWCISADVSADQALRLTKKSKMFASAYKKAKAITEMRLAALMIEEPKRCIPIIFSLKNKAGWRDDPDAAKGNKSNQLTIILGLPSKNTLSLPDKSKMVNAKATVIEESPLSKARKLVQAHEMAHQIPVKSKVKFRKLRQDTDSQPSVDVTLEASSVSPDEVGSNAVNTDQAKPLSSLSSVVGPAVSLSETSGGSLSDLIPPNDDTPLSGAASGSIPLSSLSLE